MISFIVDRYIGPATRLRVCIATFETCWCSGRFAEAASCARPNGALANTIPRTQNGEVPR